jgi:hypothetical protein
LLLIQGFRVAFIDQSFHFLATCPLSDELFDLGQSFEQPVFEDDFSAGVHESDQSLSTIVMLVVLFVVPGDCLRLDCQQFDFHF